MKCNIRECHASCCGIVPIPKDTFLKNKHLIPGNENIKTFDFTNGTVIAIRPDKTECAFLDPVDYFCRIYNERPKVCRRFGEENETETFLQCIHKNNKGAK